MSISHTIRILFDIQDENIIFEEDCARAGTKNGRIEGINNKIKVLNRVAYGYRNFKNYKNRILLHFAYKPVELQKKKTQNKTHVSAA